MVIGINQDAYRVDKANWKIYSGLSSGVGTLNGDGLPAVSFRCAVTISSTTGHTDCTGSITIDGETLNFTAAGKKITTTTLTALPVISCANLDCTVLVEAITTGGAPILQDSISTIKCRFMNTQKAFLDSAGAWTQSQAIADVVDPTANIGDVFSKGNYDYNISQVQAFTNFNGSETYRRLYLSGMKAVPPARAEVFDAMESEGISMSDFMRKSVYDPDGNGIADEAEAIPVLSAVPEDLSGYADGAIFKVGSKTYVVHKS